MTKACAQVILLKREWSLVFSEEGADSLPIRKRFKGGHERKKRFVIAEVSLVLKEEHEELNEDAFKPGKLSRWDDEVVRDRRVDLVHECNVRRDLDNLDEQARPTVKAFLDALYEAAIEQDLRSLRNLRALDTYPARSSPFQPSPCKCCPGNAK